MRRARTLVTVMAAALVLNGCSQVAAIAPVGGDRLATVRSAAIDVLTAADTDILAAPVCTEDDDATVTCKGSTFAGDDIRVSAPGSAQDDLAVTVGADILYQGSLQAVIEKAMAG